MTYVWDQVSRLKNLVRAGFPQVAYFDIRHLPFGRRALIGLLSRTAG